MNLISKPRNVLRAILQMWAPVSIKQQLWDKEFGNGRWDYLDSTAQDCIYAFIERYARKGKILDLGCGSGNTANELNSAAYGSYVGVDISDVALQKARSRSEILRRSSINTYVQGDIEGFMPDGSFDLILFRESLFYVPQAKIKKTLVRYAGHLAPEGVIIVRMCDKNRYSHISKIIEENFQVLETHTPANVTTIVHVFRTRE